MLDFQPNAVHAGIYAALASGAYADRGIDLDRARARPRTTDAPKLLESGRADFAILDIHDLAIARERGLDPVAIAPIVQRPLAAVIAADRDAVREPADLEGGEAGVTGLPSDDAVLDSVLESGGADPDAVDRRSRSGSRPSLSSPPAGSKRRPPSGTPRALRSERAGVPTREFRVDDYGAPRYSGARAGHERPGLPAGRRHARGDRRGLRGGRRGPRRAASTPCSPRRRDSTEAEQRAQLDALIAADAFSPPGRFDQRALREWADWDLEHGVVAEPIDVDAAFAFGD